MQSRGSDIHRNLEISLKQAGEGMTTILNVDRADGELSLPVTVPAGVDTGSRLRFGGKGEPGIGDEPPGDLYVVINVSAHELFERKGADLFTQAGVTSEQLKRGDQISIETLLDGSSPLQIPANTMAGAVFRMKGMGMPDLLKGRGDLYVTLAYLN